MLILGDAYDFFIGHACKAVISFFAWDAACIIVTSLI